MPEVPTTQKVWKLIKYVEGELKHDHFKLVEEKVDSTLEGGEIFVRTIYLSLDPTLINWAHEHPPYTPQIPLGGTFVGNGLLEVIASKDSAFTPGQLIIGGTKFQEYAIIKKTDIWAVAPKIDPKFPLHVILSNLGMTAWTAFVGAVDLGEVKAGETIVVSGAFGAVGLMVSQIAKIKGLRVVGIAGGEAKCKKYVEELGFDACLNYRDPKWVDQIAIQCPKGIDVYFDNVGGAVTAAVLNHFNLFGRFIFCGAISQYQNTKDTSTHLSNYMQILFRSLVVKGLFVFHHVPRFPAIIEQIYAWMQEGKLAVPPVTISNGIETAIAQLESLYKGGVEGKSLVQLGALPTPYHN